MKDLFERIVKDKGPLGITAQRQFGAPIETATCDLDVELRTP